MYVCMHAASTTTSTTISSYRKNKSTNNTIFIVTISRLMHLSKLSLIHDSRVETNGDSFLQLKYTCSELILIPIPH